MFKKHKFKNQDSTHYTHSLMLIKIAQKSFMFFKNKISVLIINTTFFLPAKILKRKLFLITSLFIPLHFFKIFSR